MLHLNSVVEGRGVEMARLRAESFRDIEWSERVHSDEGSELRTVTRSAENVLVEEEVGAEENQHWLQVDKWWVLGRDNNSWVRRFHCFY